MIPVVASAIRSRMQRASSKSSRAAAVRLRSRQRPILTPAAANAAPADFRRRAYSKRSSVEFRIFTAYLLRVVDHHYHHLSLCRLTVRCWVHGLGLNSLAGPVRLGTSQSPLNYCASCAGFLAVFSFAVKFVVNFKSKFVPQFRKHKVASQSFNQRG